VPSGGAHKLSQSRLLGRKEAQKAHKASPGIVTHDDIEKISQALITVFLTQSRLHK
jgi:hypothetical protein